MKTEIKVDDLVVAKFGSPLMTVERIKDGTVCCSCALWSYDTITGQFRKGETLFLSYNPESLTVFSVPQE